MTLPITQHIGKPAVPTVRVGQEVLRGQPIARADGFMSVPIHAPADGVVEAIEPRPTAQGNWVDSIVIRVYPGSVQEQAWGEPRDMDALTPEEIVQAVWDAGLVGLGGAAFPSHVKLASRPPGRPQDDLAPSGGGSGQRPGPGAQPLLPKDQAIHTLVVNGCECEPYLTCDHRMMLELTDELLKGIGYAMRAVGALRAVIGVEDNKLDAVAAIRRRLPADGSISVVAVPTKYPQGAEKMLIHSLLGLDVPPGRRASEFGVVVNNVGTLAMMGRLLPLGHGLTERVVTVTGPGIARPGDYWVPIGTPMRHVLAWAGAQDVTEREIILGGPMMGQAVASLDVPVTKGVSGILVFDGRHVATEETPTARPCIKCGECVKACPMGLNPSMLGLLAGKGEYEIMGAEYHLGDCFECGCCTFVCPSNIPLVQQFRVAKGMLREKGRA